MAAHVSCRRWRPLWWLLVAVAATVSGAANVPGPAFGEEISPNRRRWVRRLRPKSGKSKSSKKHSKAGKSNHGDDDDGAEETMPTGSPSRSQEDAPTTSPDADDSGGTLGPTCEFDLLYENDFESPNQDPVRTTYGVLDSTFINVMYGKEKNNFTQTFTVETFFLIDSVYPPANEMYRGDPQTRLRGSYAIGMQGDGPSSQNDLLALGFNLAGRRFLEISMDVTPIGLFATRGFGSAWPFDSSILKMSILDDPSGAVPVAGATELDTQTITVEIGSDPWIYNWQRLSVSLDAQGATNDTISIVWDFKNQGYNLFDNMVIRAVDDC